MKAQMNSKSEILLMSLSTCSLYRLLGLFSSQRTHNAPALSIPAIIAMSFIPDSIEQASMLIVIWAGQVEVTSLQQRVCRVTEANSGKMSLCSENALAPYGQLPLFSLPIPQGRVNERDDR